MPKTIKQWTISGFHGYGTLANSEVGTITFGKKAAIAKLQMNKIDLTEMAHGTAEDVKEATVPCFIAAADLIDQELKRSRQVSVHCANGRSRTGFVLITFLVRHAGFSHDEACQLIKAGQDERTDLLGTFDVNAIGPRGSSYNEFLLAEDSRKSIADKNNRVQLAAAHVQSEVPHGMNKIAHFVVRNRAAYVARKTRRTKSTLTVNTRRSRKPRRIRPSELKLLLKEAETFKKWPS